MIENRKDRIGCNQATLKSSEHASNFTGLAVCIKAVIATLAPWGLLPVAVAWPESVIRAWIAERMNEH